MKKLILHIAVIIVIIFGFSFFEISAYADEPDEGFFNYLISETSQYKSTVDISEYMNKNDWNLDDLKFQLKYFYLSEPSLFFVRREVSIKYSDDLSMVLLEFGFDYSKAEVEAMKKSMKKAALKATEGITDDMTEVEKALAVHDYIILNTSYDHNEQYYTAYDCLVRKNAVCQGYSLAYMYILRDILGMECTIVFTDSENHSWNYVRIGNSWYHIDLTSDDPTFITYSGKRYDAKGEVLHNNFLLSDEAFYKTSNLHRKWDTMGKPEAKSTKYDKFFWRDSTSAMFRIDGLWYYTALDKKSPGVNYEAGGDRNVYTKLRTYDFKARKAKTVYTVDDSWNVRRDPDTGEMLDIDSWYLKSYMKIVPIGGYIYFNTSEHIYRFNISTGKAVKIYSLNRGDKQIFSIVPYGDSSIRVVYKNDLTYENKYIKLKIS